MAVDGILRFDTKIDTDGVRLPMESVRVQKKFRQKCLTLKFIFSTNDRKFSLLRGSF